MTQAVHPWAPVEIAGREVLRETVTQAAAQWTAEWFADLKLSLSRWEVTRDDVAAEVGGHAKVYRRTLAIGLGDRAASRLLARALDIDVIEAGSTDADRKVLDHFSGQLFEDLLGRLEASLGLDTEGQSVAAPPRALRGGVRAGLGEASGGVLIHVALPLHAVLGLCRRSLPKARPQARVLDAPLRAIAGERVELEAVLGRVRLALSDLNDLASGDILILGRGLNEPADLVDARSGARVARAVMTNADGKLALALHPPAA